MISISTKNVNTFYTLYRMHKMNKISTYYDILIESSQFYYYCETIITLSDLFSGTKFYRMLIDNHGITLLDFCKGGFIMEDKPPKIIFLDIHKKIGEMLPYYTRKVIPDALF